MEPRTAREDLGALLSRRAPGRTRDARIPRPADRRVLACLRGASRSVPRRGRNSSTGDLSTCEQGEPSTNRGRQRFASSRRSRRSPCAHRSRKPCFGRVGRWNAPDPLDGPPAPRLVRHDGVAGPGRRTNSSPVHQLRHPLRLELPPSSAPLTALRSHIQPAHVASEGASEEAAARAQDEEGEEARKDSSQGDEAHWQTNEGIQKVRVDHDYGCHHYPYAPPPGWIVVTTAVVSACP